MRTSTPRPNRSFLGDTGGRIATLLLMIIAPPAPRLAKVAAPEKPANDGWLPTGRASNFSRIGLVNGETATCAYAVMVAPRTYAMMSVSLIMLLSSLAACQV